MIKHMRELYSMLQAVPAHTPVLVSLGDGKSHDTFVDGNINLVIFTQGYGKPCTYDAEKMLGELAFYRPYAEIVITYGSTTLEVESLVYDGETFHINAKIN